jgi:hypothetical protein
MRDNDTAHAHVLADEAFAVDRQLLDRYPKNARIFHDLAATSAVIGDLAQAQSYLARARALGWVEHRSTRIDPRLSAISTTENSPNLVGTAVSTSAATARAHE